GTSAPARMSWILLLAPPRLPRWPRSAEIGDDDTKPGVHVGQAAQVAETVVPGTRGEVAAETSNSGGHLILGKQPEGRHVPAHVRVEVRLRSRHERFREAVDAVDRNPKRPDLRAAAQPLGERLRLH